MKRTRLNAVSDWLCCGTLLTFGLCLLAAAVFLVACCAGALL